MGVMEIAKGKRVLVLEGYCKQTLPFLRGFRELGCDVTVLCGSKMDCSYLSRLPHHKIVGVCDVHNPKGSEEYICNLVKTGNYDLVFSPFEFASRILAHNKEELSRYAIIYVNDGPVFDAANDKNQVMKVCMENNIPCPYTIFGVKSLADVKASGIPFPIIIKPRQGYGGRGFHAFDSFEELEAYVTTNNTNLEEYVIQERIPKDRRGLACTIFTDRNGEVKSAFSYECKHMYPEVGGTSTLNALVDAPEVAESCARLTKLMKLQGIVAVDIMVDPRDGKGKVIEINVRSPHAIAIGFASGFKLCQQIMEDAYGLEVTKFDCVRTDFCMRIGQTDILWFLTSPDRFRKTPRKMGFKKVKEQMFFWDDPMPWFGFLLSGLFNFRKTMKEKKQ